MKKILLFLLFTICSLLFTTVPTFAKVISSEKAVSITANEVIDDDLYIGGPTVDIAGTINGDLYIGSGTADITGEVKGDVLAGSGIINISGKVGGNIRVGGGQVSIHNAEVSGSVTAFGGSISIGENTKISGGVLVGGGQVTIDADIARGIVGGAGTLAIGGKVGKEIRVAADTITIKKTAEITDDISYTSENEINIAEGSVVSGKVNQIFPTKAELPKGFPDIARRVGSGFPSIAKGVGFGFKIWAFFAALLIGSILIYFFPRHTDTISMRILEKPWQSLLWGFLVTVLVSPAIILLMVTGVGIPLGFIVLSIFILEIYLAKIFVGLLFGRSLFEFLGKKDTNAYLSLALGLIVYYVLTSLPIVGPFVVLATFLFGLGAIFTFTHEAIIGFRQD